MTHEEINIAIAQACGYSKHPAKSEWLIPGGENHRHYSAYWICESELPNYAGSLDAMHEAEKTLCALDGGRYQRQYALMISSVVSRVSADEPFDEWMPSGLDDALQCIMANAAQRAEAFLRTLNLWTE